MLRRRISRLVSDGCEVKAKPKDLWWDFDANTNAEELGGSVAEVIIANAYPWLSALRSRRAVAECLRESNDIFDNMPPARISLCVLDALLDGNLHLDAFEELKAKFPAWAASIDMALHELRRSGKFHPENKSP